MIKTLLSSLFAVFLFAMGAVGAWYFVEMQDANKPSDADEMVPNQEMGLDSLTTGTDDAAADITDLPAAGPSLPAPVRGRTLSPEERFRFGVLYEKQIEEIKRREEYLQDQQSRLQLVRKDMDQQKLEIEGMLQQAKDYMGQGERLLAQVQDDRRSLEQEKEQRDSEVEQLKNATKVPTEVEQVNLNKVSTLLGGMNEQEAASVLREWVNEGDMDYALRVLDGISERDASKILDAMEDPVLIAQIAAAFQDLKRAPKKKVR